MSLLSTFAILFDTDAKEATSDVEALSGALDDVEESAEGATESVDDSTKAFEEGSEAAGQLTKSIAKMAAAYIALKAVADASIDAAQSIDSVGKLSQTLGINIADLDAWGVAVERNGGTAEGLRGTVESLQSSLQDISIDGGGEIINTLAMIGVQATTSGGKIKSAFDVLPEIASAFSNMSTEQSFAFGKKLGLDQGTILTLQQSRHEIDKLVERQKSLGGVTKEGYEKAAKFNDQWSDTKRVFNSLWISSNNTILPMFEKILKGFEIIGMWIKDNQSLVENFFIGVAGVITAVYLPAMIKATVATAAFLLPWLPLIAIMAIVGKAIQLVVEDFNHWAEGTDSVLGRILGPFEDFKKKMLDIFSDLKKGWKEFTDFVSDPSAMIDAGNEFLNENVNKPVNEFIQKFIGSSDDTEKAKSTISSYSSTSLNHGGSSSTQSTQNNTITVGGASIDARGMTQNDAKIAFSAGLKETIEMAMGQLEDGVQR